MNTDLIALCKGKDKEAIFGILYNQEKWLSTLSMSDAKKNGIRIESHYADIQYLKDAIFHKKHNNLRILKIYEPIFRPLVDNGEMDKSFFEEIMAI